MKLSKEILILEELRNNIEQLDESSKADVYKVAREFRAIIKWHGVSAQYAMALVGAEMAAAETEQ